jgi:hypothetical protein
VTRAEAIEIARAEVDFEPDRVSVRFLPRGIPSRPTWGVSLVTLAADGAVERAVVVVVDARTGEIAEVREDR